MDHALPAGPAGRFFFRRAAAGLSALPATESKSNPFRFNPSPAFLPLAHESPLGDRTACCARRGDLPGATRRPVARSGIEWHRRRGAIQLDLGPTGRAGQWPFDVLL